MKMLTVKVMDNEEIYVNPNNIILLKKGSDNGTKIVVEGMYVINSIDPLANVLLDLERLNYDKKKRNKIPLQPELLSLDMLKALICKGDTGLLFCFGSSFISRVIQAKTKKYDEEIVPSHVAMIVDGQFLYESTSAPERLGYKRIPAGVRRYLLKDFLRLERTKNTEYYFYPCSLSSTQLEKYLFYPYGKDTIVDFLLRDGSEGDSRGLICSQYANICSEILDDEPCPSPAVLFRAIRSKEL